MFGLFIQQSGNAELKTSIAHQELILHHLAILT
jgi:hypothetical protein